MAFVPGSVTDFCNHRLHVFTGRIEAIVKADRIHSEAEVSKVCQQIDGARRPFACVLKHQVSHAFIQRSRRIAQIVSSTESSNRWPASGPESSPSEDTLNLGEICVHHKQSIAKRMFHRIKAAMYNMTFIKAASHETASLGISASHTRIALTTPSSWKPLPQ